MKTNKFLLWKLFIYSFIFINLLSAADLIKQLKTVNKPPFVVNNNLIVGTYPNSKITITLNAVDPEKQDIYTILNNANIGDGITCKAQNAIQIVCNIPNLSLTKADECFIHTISGKKTIPFCKNYIISYHLKDSGYEDLPPAQSKTYIVTLRVSDDLNDTNASNIDFRSYNNSLKGDFAVTNYNTNTIGNILPSNLKNMYEVSSDEEDKGNLLNNKIKNNTAATNAMGNSISGTDSDYLLSKADSITTGTAVSSAPIYCTIKRAGLFGNTAYICSIDPLLSISPEMATKYYYDNSDVSSQKTALTQCQDSCKEAVKCLDVSGNIYYTLINNENYILQKNANVNVSYDNDNNVSKFEIIKKTNDGKELDKVSIGINNVPLSEFYWVTNNDYISTSRRVGDIYFKCDFRSNLDIKISHDTNSFYVEPESTCYISYEGTNYPDIDDNNLYSFKLLYFKPQYTCPLGDDYMVFSKQKKCNDICNYQGDCLTITSGIAIDKKEYIKNNCKDVVLTNGEKLSEAVQKKECKLVNEVSLDENGKPYKTFVRNGIVVNPLRDDIGFSQDNSLLNKENAIEMLGSFINMNLKGKNALRIASINNLNDLIGFDGKIKDKPYESLASIHKRRDNNASVSIALKINPSIIADIENKNYTSSEYEILPIVMLTKSLVYGENERFLKTYYLLNLNMNKKKYIDNFNFLKRDAIITRVDGGKIESPNNLLFKLSDGSWGITQETYFNNEHINFLRKSKLKYKIIKVDDYLTNYNNKNKDFNTSLYLSLTFVKNIVGVTDFTNLENSYNDYLRNKNKYYEKDRDFNKYSIIMLNNYNISTGYVSTLNNLHPFEKSDTESLVRVGNRYYLDKNKDGVIDDKDKKFLKIDGWYFNIASKIGDSREWSSDENSVFDREITEQDVIGSNWSLVLNGTRDYGGAITATLNYPVRMKFSWAGDDYHVGIAIYNNNEEVGCYRKNVSNNAWNCSKTIPNYAYFQSRTGYSRSNNLLNTTGNYFIMFYRDGGRSVDWRDYIRVDFETTNPNPPFKWAIPRNPQYCPNGFINDNNYCYKQATATSINLSEILPIEEEISGTQFDDNNLRLSNPMNKWYLNLNKDINISQYIKKVNLWDSLRKGNFLVPFWLGYFNFNSFENGKLFIILDTKEHIDNLIRTLKNNNFGVNYLINKIENDYVSTNPKLFAWDMNNRYKNSIIYQGKNLYSGFDSINVNKFITYFGLNQHNVLCPENFHFDYNKLLCVNNNDYSILSTAFPDYFTNQLNVKNGPLYAAYERNTLFVKMVPELGMNIESSDIVCPKGYSYNDSNKQCIKHSELLNGCTAPNGDYDFNTRTCIAPPNCSNQGVFDNNTGKCVKLTPSNYTGENGYYFVYEDNDNDFKFYTPLSIPQHLKCQFKKYKCSINGEIFNSFNQCYLLCKNYDSAGNLKHGECAYIETENKKSFDSFNVCKDFCKEEANSFNWYGDLEISNVLSFNKHSNLEIYKNGSLIRDSYSLSEDGLLLGNNGKLNIKVKPGDVVKIVFKPVWQSTQYVLGAAYWNDLLGDRTIDSNISGVRCFNLNNYYPVKDSFSITLDVDLDNKSDASINIPSFYCLSNSYIEKTIEIDVLGNKLKVNYYDNTLAAKFKTSNIEYSKYGNCIFDNNSSSGETSVIPYFTKDIGNEYIRSLDAESTYYPSNSYFGVKSNEIEEDKINNFKNHFGFYSTQTDYDLLKNSSNLKDDFNLYQYFDTIPSYLDNRNIKFLFLNDVLSKKHTYELGIETLSKNDINFKEYNPKQIYDLINSKKEVPLPVAKGVFVDDNVFIKIPHISKRKVTVGFGYSPFEDCRSDSQSDITVQSNITYVSKTDCSFRNSMSWKYDSSLKKCISEPNSDGSCMYGMLVNGQCQLAPKCPENYIDNGNDCKKYIVKTVKSNEKICKSWWTLKREYVCDKLKSGLDGYIFGLPRWITIKKVPVYKYKYYNFND